MWEVARYVYETSICEPRIQITLKEFPPSSFDWRDAQDQGPGECSPVLTILIFTFAQVTFGGNVAYVPQLPWIRNATVRENIVFGSEEDEGR